MTWSLPVVEGKARTLIIMRRRAGWSYKQIAAELDKQLYPTVRGGKRWHHSTVRGVCVEEHLPNPGLRPGPDKRAFTTAEIRQAYQRRDRGDSYRVIAANLRCSTMTAWRLLNT